MIFTALVSDWDALLQAAHGNAFPKEIGTGEGARQFSDGVRVQIIRRFRILYRALAKESPMVEEDFKVFFGKRDYWRKAKPIFHPETGNPITSRELELKPEHRKTTETVEISKMGCEGVFWTLYLWAHPSSPAFMGAGFQERVVWTLAEKFRYTRKLEKETGLDLGETIQVETDDELAELNEDEGKDENGEASPDPKKAEGAKV